MKIILENKKNQKAGVQTAILKARTSREDYLKNANKMLAHIMRGDIYEVNYCTEFYAESVKLNTLYSYHHLNELSKAPFSVYGKWNHLYMMGASPERYLAKRGRKIISQPIKGTARRSSNLTEDQELKNNLISDSKERAENIMIVDLVRNDLSITAQKGSVRVEELFGLYTFEQVHQMISTVTSTLKEGLDVFDVLKSSFPMGSMTGAPKVRAMQLIEDYEHTKRGAYSGAVGYITPEGDADFNVVIRTILYNKENSYASFMVGSALTSAAIPENEYLECFVKADALLKVLENQGIHFTT